MLPRLKGRLQLHQLRLLARVQIATLVKVILTLHHGLLLASPNLLDLLDLLLKLEAMLIEGDDKVGAEELKVVHREEAILGLVVGKL